MAVAYVVITVLVAAVNGASAAVDIRRDDWVIVNMGKLGVPESWLVPLGLAKGIGAVGLLVGIGLPLVGVAAAAGLVAYFVGAIITVLRARWWQHLVYPGSFLVLAMSALSLRLVVS